MLHKLIALTWFVFLPGFIFGHGSHGSGFMAGFTHPILGLDHNVAILSSGFLGYLLDQKRWYFAPLIFIFAMVLGGFIGIDKEATLVIENIIAFSVFIIGVIIAFRSRLPLVFVLLIQFVFGYFHGYAHGVEMPVANTVIEYIPGYTLGAILLGALGVFIGMMAYLSRNNEKFIIMVSGMIMGSGIMLLLS